MADQRSSLAAQFLLSAAAALRQPDSQLPTNDHEYKSLRRTTRWSLDDRLRPFVPALPNLLSTAGADHQDALVPSGWWSKLYDVQADQRSAGASQARVMTGKRGTLSLWHIDHDDRAVRTRNRWMATFILWCSKANWSW